ncbi:MAG: DMT family transporter [Desulfobacterales bacterium]|nr:DMT family transporter [Desulfobacterales bacterium]
MPKIGYGYVCLAAVLWAAAGSGAKFLFNSGITPYQLIQLRVTLAFCGLLLWLAGRNRPLLKIDRKDLFYFCLLGILGIGAAQFFYLFAISKIKVAAAILLHYTGPVFVALYAAVFRHQKLTHKSGLALLGTAAGCFLVVGAYDLDLLALNRSGIVGGLLAAAAFATYTLLSEYGMAKYSPWTVLLYGLLFAALAWNVLHPPFEAILQFYAPAEWFWILFIAVCGTILPFGLYFEGINRIRSTHASITATLEPITAGVISALFLGEMLSPLQVLGAVVVIASIILLQWKNQKK